MKELGDYLRGMKDAAQLADFWSLKNFRLAADTVKIDPILNQRDTSRKAIRAAANAQ